MKKGMTIIYPEYNGLYINLTNRCPCACTFCIRQKSSGAEFDNVETLWLEREPDAQEVIEAIKAEAQTERFKSYKEFVFCGYGEPTEVLDVLLEVASFLKANFTLPVRINTNGLGNLINKKDIVPLLAGKIDALSISLNSSNPEIYEATVRPVFKEKAFPAMIQFAEEAGKVIPKVILSTVETTISKEDEENCTRLCEKLGVIHRIRKFIDIK
ncbi:TatD family nuclease-associated radical SAM protein [uncultured Treponema sp.]|uniref:TatD family nuclease-associated radical SAM protein n=1 Tax=uncultured Treponema sp. TaxID=162155 RepID=UPI0025DBB644|nr:TatD family nuclease-associated radical SAM protein [uncultured Treponema sp.]